MRTFFGNRRRDRSEDCKRRKAHDVIGHLEHDLDQAIHPFGDGSSCFTDRGQRDSEKERKDDNLQNLIVRHCFDNRLRHEVSDEVLEAEPGGSDAVSRRGRRNRQSHANARIEDVHEQ